MRSKTYLSLSFLLLVSSLAGGYTDRGNSFSSGGTSVSTGGKAFASAGGSATVRTRTSVSSSSQHKSTTQKPETTGTGDTASTKFTKKKRSGGRGWKKPHTTEKVELGEGTSVCVSSASGTGSVRAFSSASSTPTHSKGTASTTVGGVTRTVTKETGDKAETKGARSYEHYPTCRGMAYFRCCADRSFEEIGGEVYCGCFGDEPRAEFCSFLRLNSKPLVVQDVFGSASGEICVCADDRATTNEIVNGCRGTVKRDCCDSYNGDKKCRCKGDTCAYARVSNKPLMWKSRTSNRLCVCH